MRTPVSDSWIWYLNTNLASDYDVKIFSWLPIINDILITFSLHHFEHWHKFFQVFLLNIFALLEKSYLWYKVSEFFNISLGHRTLMFAK